MSQSHESLMLFTTKVCPACRVAKAILAEKNIEYTVVDANEKPELTKKYGISAVPTLIMQGEGDDFGKYVGSVEIRKYLEK